MRGISPSDDTAVSLSCDFDGGVVVAPCVSDHSGDLFVSLREEELFLLYAIDDLLVRHLDGALNFDIVSCVDNVTNCVSFEDRHNK
jgi:hypothetical protein